MPKLIPGLIIGLALASFAGLALLPSRLGSGAQRLSQAGPEEAPPAASEARDTGWPAALAHHNFILHSFDGFDLAEKDLESALRAWPNLSFSQWPEVSGRFCNHFRGQAEVTDEGRLKITAAATRMMCLEESINQQEHVFHRITASGAELDLSPDGRLLTISGDGHTLVFRLSDYAD